MHAKRVLAAALVTASLATALPVLPAEAASLSSFPDIADAQVAEAAEFLRAVEVVGGLPGGTYNPSGTLTRAEFCKMAICALGIADREPANRGRTIYLDVGPTHWARGYINLAASYSLGGEEDPAPLVTGLGDGTFQPNRPITYAEAVAILCRVLNFGLSDISAGGHWYDGYLDVGSTAGLTESLTNDPKAPISRGDAAILFYNLYFSNPKGEENSYLEKIGGSEKDNVILLATDVKAEDGTPGAVSTTDGTYKTDRVFNPSLSGSEGTILLDADKKLLAFRPKDGGSQRSVNILSATAASITLPGGQVLDVAPATPVYHGGEATTLDKIYMDLYSVPAILHYAADGKLTHIFIPAAAANEDHIIVARTLPGGKNVFASMAGGGSYTMFKNGMPAVDSDIRQYDVAIFDPATRMIQVSDMKLTGIYEKAEPTPVSPLYIWMMGHKFEVLSSARKDLESFKVGDRITLLLTGDNRVAGAVSDQVVKSNAVGIAHAAKDSVTVKLLGSSLELSGQSYLEDASRFDGQVVNVSSGSIGRLSLSPLPASQPRGALDVAARTLGGTELAANVMIYDKVKDGATAQVSYNSLTIPTVPAHKIRNVSYDYAGRVRYIVLDDVTGDAYTYGIFLPTAETKENNSEDHMPTVKRLLLSVLYADSDGNQIKTDALQYDGKVTAFHPGGIAHGSKVQLAAWVELQELENIHRTSINVDAMTVTAAGVTYPIAPNVQCYNESTKTWFKPGKEGLEAARAYAEHLDLFYDRDPSKCGKIRVIVIN